MNNVMKIQQQSLEDPAIMRIKQLNLKIGDGLATNEEKDEYVNILYENKELSDTLYKSYKNNEFVDKVLRTALILGGIIIVGLMWNKALKNPVA